MNTCSLQLSLSSVHTLHSGSFLTATTRQCVSLT